MKKLILILMVLVTVSSCKKEEIESNLVVETIQVYNGNAPLSWAELDVSNAVGQSYAMVTLKISNLSSSNGIAAIFRQKGDIVNYLFGIAADNAISLGYDGVGQTIIYTDRNGKIEWKANETNSVKIDVVAFIK